MGGSGSSGGGSSGKVDFPSHMKDIHKYWLTGTGSAPTGGIGLHIDNTLTSAGGNPYVDSYVYDPRADLDDVEDRYELYAAVLRKFDAKQDWRKILQESEDGLAESVLSDDEIEAKVTQFEAEQTTTLARSVSRFNAGMVDINAVRGSAFIVGNASLETDFNRLVAKFRADLMHENHKLKFTFITQSNELIARMFLAKISAEHSAVHLLAETKRVGIILKTEHLDKDLGLLVQEVTWDTQLYQDGANLLASIGGGTAVPGTARGPSRTATAVGGALSGAAAGAQIGGVVSQAGSAPAIGAGIGAALVAVSAFL